MSQVKAKDLRSLSAVELNQKKAGFEKDLHDLRQKQIIGQLEKPHLFKSLRRQIAQINTVQNQTKKS